MQNNLSSTFSFRTIRPGIDFMPHSLSLPRHRHLGGYVTVVLTGTMEEAGYAGRIEAKAGDVLIHPRLDAHANHKVSAGVRLVRLEWSDPLFSCGLYAIDDIDRVATTAQKCPVDAASLLGELLRNKAAASPRACNDWPDQLAGALISNVSVRIGDWARDHRLAPESVSRGFLLAYGVSPEVFKAETRARAAWLRIAEGDDDLSAIAADTGFADQPHMNRWIRRTTGAAPGAWRRKALEPLRRSKASVVPNQTENLGSPSRISIL